MWAYIDERGCVLALNKNNMKGNTGWVEAATRLNVDDVISYNGIALYKVKDGVMVARNKNEIDSEPANESDTNIDPVSVDDVLHIAERNADRIEYVAMMSDIELPEVDGNDAQ